MSKHLMVSHIELRTIHILQLPALDIELMQVQECLCPYKSNIFDMRCWVREKQTDTLTDA